MREREQRHGDGTGQRSATRITLMIDGFRAGAPPYSSAQDDNEARTIAAAARTREIMQQLNAWASRGSAGWLAAHATRM